MNKLVQIENGNGYIISNSDIKQGDSYIYKKINDSNLNIAKWSIKKDYIYLRNRHKTNRIIGKVIIKITNIKYKNIN